MNAALNVRDYACAKVRRRLGLNLAGELSVDLSHEILEHLDRCAACSGELAGAREPARRRSPPRRRDSPSRARVSRVRFARASRALLPRRPEQVIWLLLAASLVAAAGAGTLLLLSRTPGAPVANMAAARDAKAFLFAALNHKNCALRFDRWSKAPATAAADIAPKLDAELKAAAVQAAHKLPGYEAVTAHECSHAGEKVFHIVYRKTGSTSKKDLVSVVATRRGSTLAQGVTLAGLVSGGDRDGLAVVGTSAKDGRLLFLVTDGNDEGGHALRRARPARACDGVRGALKRRKRKRKLLLRTRATLQAPRRGNRSANFLERVFVFSLLAGACALGQAALAQSPPATPVLVELFTSEGCSSCPPADRLLARLASEQPVPGGVRRRFVPACRLLGPPRLEGSVLVGRLSRRDRATYAVRFGSAGRVYTPQMVVDGRTEFVGTDEGAARRAIADAAKGTRAFVRVVADVDKGSARVTVAGSEGRGRGGGSSPPPRTRPFRT